MVKVLKDQFDVEWPTVAHQFPGVTPEFGDEENGYVELLNDQAQAMAYATSCAPPVEVEGKPPRSQHGWDDFTDNALPAAEAVEDGEEAVIEAKPKKAKRPRQKKVKV
jgi:hypothetical protein